jgi:hypothetical protein
LALSTPKVRAQDSGGFQPTASAPAAIGGFVNPSFDADGVCDYVCQSGHEVDYPWTVKSF